MTHKNITNIVATIRLALIAGLGAATSVLAVDLTKLPPAATQTGVTFEKDIQSIFKANCVDCHGAVRPRNDLRLDSLDAVLKGGRDGKVIVPGQSEKSELVVNICWEAGPEHPMPPKPQARRAGPGAANPPAANPPAAAPPAAAPPAARKELTPEQIGLIRAWIDQGAK